VENIDSKVIIVPCDFSPAAYQALEHGAHMSKTMKQRLLILHVAPKETDVPAVEKKLSFIVEECFEKFGVRPEFIVRIGTRPYSVIKHVAEKLDPTFVVLKTGGIRGIKRYTGIRTIKILSGTTVPFLVIQGQPRDSVLHNIVFPINFLKQHDAKLKRVVFFWQYYPDAIIHIITPSGKGTVKEKNVANNVAITTKVLENQGIKVNFIMHDRKSNTAETIMELSTEIDADMIMVQMQDTPTVNKFLFGLREDKLILTANLNKIPVMCINRLSHFNGISNGI
jgi:nucleotide-binding universal stress UspA family protein